MARGEGHGSQAGCRHQTSCLFLFLSFKVEYRNPPTHIRPEADVPHGTTVATQQVHLSMGSSFLPFQSLRPVVYSDQIEHKYCLYRFNILKGEKASKEHARLSLESFHPMMVI